MSKEQRIYGNHFNIFSYFISVTLLLIVLYLMTLRTDKIV
jgi:hypothetical protein